MHLAIDSIAFCKNAETRAEERFLCLLTLHAMALFNKYALIKWLY